MRKLDEKMLPLRERALLAPEGLRTWQFREEYVQEKAQRRLQADKRKAIFDQKRKLR